MKFVKTHPVYCKHAWNHGKWGINNPTNPIMNQFVVGYLCQRCQTVWKTQNENGVIKAIGDEPKIPIGICEIEIPTLDKEPDK